MIQIELSDEERDRLTDIFQKHLTELSWEIAFSHNRDSVEYLRKRREFVESLIQRLNR